MRSGGVFGCSLLLAGECSVAFAADDIFGDFAVGGAVLVGTLVGTEVYGFVNELGVPAKRAFAQYMHEKLKHQRKAY